MEGATRASAREGARWRGERERERESGGFRRGGTAPQENDGTEAAVCLSCGAACSRWARERAAGGPAQESAGQGSRKRARGRRRLAGLRSASAIAGFSPFEMEKMNAYLHPTEPLLPFSSYNEQDRRRVRAGADTLRHSTTGAAGGRRRAHTHTHTHCRTHTTQHHTRGNLVLLISIPTHPPWSWAQPESRLSRTERRLDLPVQHHKLYIQHIHQPDPKRSGRVPSWHRACTNASHSSV